jgi:serine/threonine protein kinase
MAIARLSFEDETVRSAMETRCERFDEVSCGCCGERVDVFAVEPFSAVACPACGTELTVPARFGQFDLLQVLGQGAMGEVYLAWDRTLDRRVAIKVMCPGVVNSERELAAKCIEEARALAALNHPNVVQIYSVGGEETGQPFIVMEYVSGGRLDRLLEEVGHLDEARALEVAIDVVQGLAATNKVGLAHGDVKPGNVLLDDRGVAKLVDFGIARYTDRESSISIYGTPRYAAPELALKRRGDHRSDMFSLGVMLFYCLTGQYPFPGRTGKETMRARLEQAAPYLRDVRTDLHVDTAVVVERLLQQDPDARFARYEDLLAALWQALRATRAGPGEPNLAELYRAASAAKQRAVGHGHIRRRWSVKTVLTRLVATLALAGIVGLLVWGSSKYW